MKPVSNPVENPVEKSVENDPNLRKSIRIHSYYLCLYLGTHRKHGITRQCVNCDAIEEAFMELLWKVGRVQGTVQ